MPQRVQLRRTKGWRMPEGTVSVARPTRWGNPFRADWFPAHLGEAERRRSAALVFQALIGGGGYPHYPQHAVIRAELRGKDLACWCPPDAACHADTLLLIANTTKPTGGLAA